MVSLRLRTFLVLNLAGNSNSPDRSTKSTQSAFACLPLFVSIRFQVLFHSPPGVLFTFPSQYCFTIGHQVVFRLGVGPSGFPQGFSCPVVLWILSADSQFRLPDFHRLWSAFPKQFSYRLSIPYTVRNPDKLGSSVWPISLSLAATQEIEFSFSSCRYLDVSVHDVSLP